MQNDKNALRKYYQNKRKNLSELEKNTAKENLVGPIVDFVKKHQAKTISGYVPMRGEIDCLPALTALRTEGFVTCLPKIPQKSKVLSFHLWNGAEKLIMNERLKAYEPYAGKVLIPDILLIPLLVCDSAGNRLGYGGGYYDATLRHLRQSGWRGVACGVGYPWQRHPTPLPQDAFDEKLDAFIWENR